MPKLLFNVKPGSFFPAPTVTSSVVRFDIRSGDPLPLPMHQYMDLVRAAFQQRRKVLSNGLESYCKATWGMSIKELVSDVMEIDPRKRRAEELSPQELYDLWNALSKAATEVRP
jgi:16S rRNA (adenine1518-N6/adenine1519-N6)-dimethyltransferase